MPFGDSQGRLTIFVLASLFAMAAVATFGSGLVELIAMPLILLMLLLVTILVRGRTKLRARPSLILLLVVGGWLVWTALCLGVLLFRGPDSYPLALGLFSAGTFVAFFAATRFSRRLA